MKTDLDILISFDFEDLRKSRVHSLNTFRQWFYNPIQSLPDPRLKRFEFWSERFYLQYELSPGILNVICSDKDYNTKIPIFRFKEDFYYYLDLSYLEEPKNFREIYDEIQEKKEELYPEILLISIWIEEGWGNGYTSCSSEVFTMLVNKYLRITENQPSSIDELIEW